MIKIENTEVMGWEPAIRGMRNPKNSWDRSDSTFGSDFEIIDIRDTDGNCYGEYTVPSPARLGHNDLKLATTLANAGTEHGKFLRMINVYVDITAPLYWYKEMGTYKVGTVCNSCSTMHKIHAKEFTLDDFSHEHIEKLETLPITRGSSKSKAIYDFNLPLQVVICALNGARTMYLKTNDKRYWWQMIQLLPSSYNQRRTYMLNYATLRAIYHQRKDHKLDEWHTFCDWIETLPYAKELIIGNE